MLVTAEGVKVPSFTERLIMKWMVVLIVLLGFGAPIMAQAQCTDSDLHGRWPYGDYCSGPRGGWYGDKTEVTSAGEAKSILCNYYAGDDVTIGKIVKKENYFEAEILDRNNRIVDRVIVDRRTGRIRSIY